MAADLHVHTTASDGCLNVDELLCLAQKKHLKTISITDHDSVNSIAEAINLSSKYNVEVIAGVEFSAIFNGLDLHILGYFVDYKQQWLADILSNLRKARYGRAVKMTNLLIEQGFNIGIKDIEKEAGLGTLGRAHIARALVKKKLVATIREAFDKYLKKDACCYVAKDVYNLKEILEIINQAKGISVIAHPAIYKLKEQDFKYFAKHGLRGIEVYHPDNDFKSTNYFKKLANKLDLLITGGSDCHGIKSGFGYRLGTVTVSDEIVSTLKRAVNID